MMVMRIKIKQIFNKNYIFILNNENINKWNINKNVMPLNVVYTILKCLILLKFGCSLNIFK